MENAETLTSPSMQSLDSKKKGFSQIPIVFVFIIIAVAIVLGGGVGYLLKSFGGSSSPTMKAGGIGQKPKEGLFDKKRFPDKAEGKLKEGGIEGEGNFHLVRPGGDSQNVYLTSSIVDLSKYIGKKVRVWGETFKAEKAGWLMDVGYVEVL